MKTYKLISGLTLLLTVLLVSEESGGSEPDGKVADAAEKQKVLKKTNEELNLDFRQGAEQWEGVDGDYWRISPMALSHGQSLQRVLYAGTPASSKPYEAQCGRRLPVTPGKEWLVEGYVSSGIPWTSSIRMALLLRFYDAQGRETGQFETVPRVGSANKPLKNFNRICGITTVPKKSVMAKLAVRVYVDETLQTNRFVNFDNLRTGDFRREVELLKKVRLDAPRPDPIRMQPEDAGPVTEGILSQGKFYTYSVRPGFNKNFEDQYENKWTDGTLLTDGEFQQNGGFEKHQYVGWKGRDPVKIVFDLGRVQQMGEVRIHSVSMPEVYCCAPSEARIRVRSSRDGVWTEWGKITNSMPATFSGPVQLSGKGALEEVLEVEITLRPDGSHNANKMLLSEVEIRGKIKNTWRHVPAAGKVYNGAYPPDYGFDKSLRGEKKDPVRIDLFEEVTGKPISFVLWYQNMIPRRSFPEIQEIRRRYLSENYYGTRLLIYGWLPHAIALQDIAAGQYDDFFEQYFRDSVDPAVLMGMNEPIIFRPMNEFDSSWVSLGHQPELFRKAWWRIYNIAEKIGATQKHLFCWSPNHRSYPDEAWNKMEKYYPGDQYVDWIGVSAYPPSRKFVETDDCLYPIARCRESYEKFGYKPYVISEGGFGPDHVDKVRWVKEWFELPDIYPNFIGYIWENHPNGSTVRMIQSDAEALRVYQEKVQAPRFLGHHLPNN
jgi:hypothetical protein